MIEVNNLCKNYYVSNDKGKNFIQKMLYKELKKVQALDNIGFTINSGEMVGYIGPNGAGKSTTIKILSGILTPDSGTCRINGMIPWKEREKYVKNIGVVFGQRSQLWWDLPVIESFDLLRAIYKVPQSEYKKTLFLLTDMLDLDALINIPTRQLSLGQRMRCEIAASLLHKPDLLFLDEPTIGLDAVSKKSIRQFIREINHESRLTLLLTTHDMQDIEALTDRIIFIGKGKILFDGERELLRKKYNKKEVKVRCAGTVPELIRGLELIDFEDNNFSIRINSECIEEQEAIKYLLDQVHIVDITSSELSTEDIVVQMYKEYEV